MENTNTELTADAPEGVPCPTEWRITDRQGVEWFLRRMRQDSDEISTIKAMAASMIREIEARMQRREARHLPDVMEWTRQEIERQGGKTKSAKTFQGVCQFRTVASRLVISDEQQAMEHAQSIGCVNVSIAKDEYLTLAEAAMQEGNTLPGVAMTEARESFSIQFPKGKE
jgi:phage host-nuclease inhibitor protein Gam